MNQRNYQKEMDAVIRDLEESGKVPKLLLHSCCAPCSSYVLEYLSQHFEIMVYFYNPNIYPAEEYYKRVTEIERLVGQMNFKNPVRLVSGAYEPGEFYQAVKGFEKEAEGGSRCLRCFSLRLEEAAKVCRAGNHDYFTTTLSISPLKNAAQLNEIGESIAKEYGIQYLPSDFKKRDGYKRSIQLSEEYGLYRQNYCGCVFSRDCK